MSSVVIESRFLIPARFRGPPNSGNGGYTCGRLAAFVDGIAHVRLLLPPPLETPLSVLRTSQGVELHDGQRTVARGWSQGFELAPPPCPELDSARRLSGAYLGLSQHEFPGCFVCGPEREPGDGLRIFPGAAPGKALLACTWVPGSDLADADGNVRAEFIWAALDCPGGWACIRQAGRPAVLGEFSVRIDAPVLAGEEHILTGWALGASGRKHRCGSALYTSGQRLLACGIATWLELASAKN